MAKPIDTLRCPEHTPGGSRFRARSVARPVPGDRRVTLVAAVSLLGMLLASCSGWKTSGTELRAVSESSGRELRPRFGTGVYRYVDPSTADVYLTDIPVDRLVRADDSLSDVSGNIVHLHIFLIPQAGKTPIDATACNVTVRHAVYANGAQGIYAGAGFTESDELGTRRLSGDLLGATLRLTERSSTFADALGPSSLSGSYRAELDEPAAVAIGARLARLADVLPDLPAAAPVAIPGPPSTTAPASEKPATPSPATQAPPAPGASPAPAGGGAAPTK